MSPGQAVSASTSAAFWWLTVLSFRRVWRSMQPIAGLALLVLVGIIVAIRESHRGWNEVQFTLAVIQAIYFGFMLPLLCLCFGTQSLGGDWEDRTLVWLLMRPLPRPLIYLAKYLAALPWTLALTVGGLAALGSLAGSAGMSAVGHFWMPVALASLAYLALFQLFSVSFRRSTVLGVAYSFVLETFFGNMPGLVKRASVAFYGKCLMYDIAKDLGLDRIGNRRGIAPSAATFFLPVDGETALIVLATSTVALLVLGAFIFTRKEYHDLT